MRRILEDRPSGMTVGMHLCRGNFRSRWMASGGYEPVAARLFNDFPVDVYFLEYDSQRAGDFSPCAMSRRIATSCWAWCRPRRRSGKPDDLRRRIDEAARFVDLDACRSPRNAASPASPAATRSTRTRNGRSSA